MSTPKTKFPKPSTTSASKYLTPCRTLGLKRKSTSPRTSGSKLVCMTEESDSPISSRKPFQIIENKISENISDKNVINKEGEEQKCNIAAVCEDLNTRSKKPDKEAGKLISNETLLETIKSINKKIERISNLKRNAIYSRKHDIDELRKSTEKWKNASKEVVWAIYDTMKSRGHDVSISNILDQHNIPYDYIGFNEETMEFD